MTHDSLTELISDIGVCRKALATPGLLIIVMVNVYIMVYDGGLIIEHK